MKSIKFFILFIFVFSLFILTGCGEKTCKTHNFKEAEVINATCTENGQIKYKCTECGQVKTEAVVAKGHKEVVDSRVEPTCSQTGLTEGKHCSECNAVIVNQEVIPTKEHTKVVDEAVDATCTIAGLTEGSHCSVCEQIIVKQEEIKAGHNYEEFIVAPTETENGYTNHICSKCGDAYKDKETQKLLEYNEYKTGELEVRISSYYKNNKDFLKNPITITIPDTYQGKTITKIADNGFFELSNLKEIIVEYDNEKSFYIGGNAFTYCQNLENVTILPGCEIGSFAFANCPKFDSDKLTLAKTIGTAAFKNCTSLKKFYNSDTSMLRVEKVWNNAFEGCTSLTELYLPYGSLSEYKLGYFFGHGVYGTVDMEEQPLAIPSSLNKIILYAGDTISDYSFYKCSSITEIYVINSNKGLVIGEHVFDGCTGLNKIESNNGVYVELLNGHGNELVLVDVIDKTVEEFEIANNCNSIAAKTFAGCENLIIVKQNNTQNQLISIGNNAFEGCVKLTEVDLSNVLSIGNMAFKDCGSLVSVTLPKTLTTIGNNVFVNTALTTINYSGTKEEWNEIIIGEENSVISNSTIVYNYK